MTFGETMAAIIGCGIGCIITYLITWRAAKRAGQIEERMYLRENPNDIYKEIEEPPYYD